MKALYILVAFFFLAAQAHIAQAVTCPAMTGGELRSCCCDQPSVPEPMLGCCSTETGPAEQPAAHSSCSCAWAPATPDSEPVVAVSPISPRTKLRTLHQPDVASAILTRDAGKDVARYVQPPGQTRCGDALSSTHSPMFILHCAILR